MRPIGFGWQLYTREIDNFAILEECETSCFYSRIGNAAVQKMSAVVEHFAPEFFLFRGKRLADEDIFDMEIF